MDTIINGIPLIAVIIGLVEWFKALGFSGNILRVASMFIGLILGGAYQYSVQPPVSFADWFALIIYGLALGLIASGLYDAVKNHPEI